jgi:predicted Zn-dependent protease
VRHSITATALMLLPLLSLFSCAPLSFRIPAVTDDTLERFMNREAVEILKVSDNADKIPMYRFRLANFPRKDVLGLSVGKHRIFVSYELARLAYRNEHHRWLFRHTLAHEIAHDVMGGDIVNDEPIPRPNLGFAKRINGRDLGLSGMVSFRPYSSSTELQADRKGMEYWRKLGWDCRHWVRIFQNFVKQGYHGDVDHPTVDRLNQALNLCPAASATDEYKPGKISLYDKTSQLSVRVTHRSFILPRFATVVFS